MANYIIKLGGYYLEWSTVLDAPICKGMSLDVFKIYYGIKYGSGNTTDLPGQLERVEEKGTSSILDTNLDSLLSYNRAGDNENHLTIEELITEYCSTIDRPLHNTNQSQTAQIETLLLGDNTILEVLQLTSGEQRIDIHTAAEALGKHSGYLDSLSVSYKSVLEDRGFTDERKNIFILSRNLTYITISVADFIKIAIQGALLGDRQATIILAAFAEIGIESLSLKLLSPQKNY